MVRQKLGLFIKKLTWNSWNFMLTAHMVLDILTAVSLHLGFGVRDDSGY